MEFVKADIKIGDELHLSQDKTITKQLESGENILHCSIIGKHNNRDAIQKRVILITTKYIYNLAYEGFFMKLLCKMNPRSVIKRKIPIEAVSAFTVSCDPSSSQFVIHVEKQHDYRYSGGGKERESAIYAICMAFRRKTGRKIPVHFKEEPDLASYQTHENDVKKRINKRPKDAAYPISDLELSLGLDFFIKGRKYLTKNDAIVRMSIANSESGDWKCSKEDFQLDEGSTEADRKSPEKTKINLPEENKQLNHAQLEPYNENGIEYKSIPVTTSVIIKK